MRALAICVLAVALVGAAAPAGAQARCPGRGVHYLARGPQAIVFTLRGPHGLATYACRSSRSRPVLLDDPNTPTLLRSALRVAGHYIAFQTKSHSGDAGDDQILRVDLNTARAVTFITDRHPFILRVGDQRMAPRRVTSVYLGGDTVAPNGGPFSVVIALRRDGAFAFALSFEQRTTLTQIWLQPGRTARMVDEGLGVREGVLALTPDRRSVTWINNGQRRTAPLKAFLGPTPSLESSGGQPCPEGCPELPGSDPT